MATVKPQEQYPDRELKHGKNQPIESTNLRTMFSKPMSSIVRFRSPIRCNLSLLDVYKAAFIPNAHNITQSLGALGTGSVALFQLGLVHIYRFYHHTIEVKHRSDVLSHWQLQMSWARCLLEVANQ